MNNETHADHMMICSALHGVMFDGNPSAGATSKCGPGDWSCPLNLEIPLQRILEAPVQGV